MPRIPFSALPTKASAIYAPELKANSDEFKVNIAGPTTLAALLNSLQMGFKTLAIQKSSGEVMKVLEEVKDEFGRFADYLQRTKTHLDQAGRDIDHLLGTRTNQMRRKLNGVTRLTAGDAVEEIEAGETVQEELAVSLPD